MSSRTFSAEQLREVIALFQVYGDIVAVNRYGSGHINDTFKVDISLGGVPVSYILQRINDGAMIAFIRLRIGDIRAGDSQAGENRAKSSH